MNERNLSRKMESMSQFEIHVEQSYDGQYRVCTTASMENGEMVTNPEVQTPSFSLTQDELFQFLDRHSKLFQKYQIRFRRRFEQHFGNLSVFCDAIQKGE